MERITWKKVCERGGCRGVPLRNGVTNTNKPHNFLQNTSCIRKPQVISVGGGGGAYLHPPPKSASA